ncbi:MAG TPA: glycosyltransferase family 4 protein [Candidatus Acidoferrales bacterium]|nr:glycosyltransferase family 4 protein [Candidatus Acidoferrales bacterium]
MRIIQASSYFYPHIGGVETHVYELSQSLVEMGHEVTVICAEVPKSKQYESLNGFTVLRFPAIDLPYIPYIYFLKNKLSKLKADVIHSHYPPPFMSQAVLTALKDVPHVLTYHCDVIIPETLSKLKIPKPVKRIIECANKRLYLNFILNNVTKLIATTNSYATTSEILKNLNFEVVPNGIRLQKFDKALKEINAEREANTILFVGRLTSVKGVNYFIEAAKTVIKEYPKTNFLIVGRGEDEEILLKLSKGYEANIKFFGHVSWHNLIRLYKMSTALVLPSFTRLEAFGIVLLEAMACETPIIASDIPGVNDVTDGAGFLVEPKNPEKIADAVLRVFANADESRSMGKRGRRLVESKYDWKVVTKQILNVYKDAIEL